jgi:hypothetical protein
MGGESGPKARPNGVVDGKQVNIPVLIVVGTEGRRRLSCSCAWNAAEAFETSIGRIKTTLELRRDPILRDLSRMDVNYVILPRKARTPSTQQ